MSIDHRMPCTCSTPTHDDPQYIRDDPSKVLVCGRSYGELCGRLNATEEAALNDEKKSILTSVHHIMIAAGNAGEDVSMIMSKQLLHKYAEQISE